MPSVMLISGLFVSAFFIIFETCLAWLCAALTKIENASILRSVKLLIFELLIPVPVSVIIGYAAGCVVGGPAGIQTGLLAGFGFALYLFLAITRSVYETSYVRAAVFCIVFIVANIIVTFAISFSPTIDNLRHAIVTWPN